MASPSTVLTLGYGSFGGVNLLPTLGFGLGVAAVPAGRRVCLHGADHRRAGLTGRNNRAGLAGGDHRRVALPARPDDC